jgi:hypothetical protein
LENRDFEHFFGVEESDRSHNCEINEDDLRFSNIKSSAGDYSKL